MTDVNTFLKRALLAAAISVLPLANTASAHGGGHGTGGSSSSSGGSSSGGSSSSGGHSSSGSNGGHSSGGHSSSSTSGGHAATASKVGHPATDPAADPSNVSVTTGHGMHSGKVHRAFAQQGQSTGYNQQNTETNQDDWRRRHPHLLFGFIRY